MLPGQAITYSRVEIADGRSIPALGPYPSRGDYEHCFTLEGSQGEFVQLTPTVAERIAQAIEWGRKFRPAQRRVALDRRASQEEREFDARAYGILDDAVPAFHKQRFVTVL